MCRVLNTYISRAVIIHIARETKNKTAEHIKKQMNDTCDDTWTYYLVDNST
jgi:hypothetical protein